MSNDVIHSLTELDNLIKVARENAILGQYEKALNKYKMSMNYIERRISESKNDLLKDKWKSTEKELKDEVDVITEILLSCETFTNVHEESGSKKLYNINKVDEQDINEPKEFVPPQRFDENTPLPSQGGHNNKKDPNEDFINNINNIKDISNKVMDNMKKLENDKNEKNEKKEFQAGGHFNYDNFAQNNNNALKRNVPQPSNNNNNNYKPSPAPSNKGYVGGGYGGGGGKRNPMNEIQAALNNYQPSDKMVQKYGKFANLGPEGYYAGGGGGNKGYSGGSGAKGGKDKGSKGGKNDKKDKNEGKSPFLMHCYPNGEGPDVELIEMLEREVVDKNPHVLFEDIAELESAKKALYEAVILPLLIPDFFKGIRRPWRGVLLYGPPGTGKTMLAKALATQGETTFFNVHSSSFASKWRGESEKLVRILFEMARFYAPTTIFIDEVDSLCSKRGEGNEGDGSRRVKAEILVQMEGVNSNTSASANNEQSEDQKKKNVTVMAATNRPWDLDDALRRRFEKRVYIPLPNVKGRQQLFDLNLKKINLASDINYDELVKATDGYSGADIANVCREAALMPMRRELIANQGRDIEELVNDHVFRSKIEAPISMDDLLKAIGNISKSVSKNDLVAYDKWTSEFSSV